LPSCRRERGRSPPSPPRLARNQTPARGCHRRVPRGRAPTRRVAAARAGSSRYDARGARRAARPSTHRAGLSPAPLWCHSVRTARPSRRRRMPIQTSGPGLLVKLRRHRQAGVKAALPRGATGGPASPTDGAGPGFPARRCQNDLAIAATRGPPGRSVPKSRRKTRPLNTGPTQATLFGAAVMAAAPCALRRLRMIGGFGSLHGEVHSTHAAPCSAEGSL
jgi:hypothetical protein